MYDTLYKFAGPYFIIKNPATIVIGIAITLNESKFAPSVADVPNAYTHKNMNTELNISLAVKENI